MYGNLISRNFIVSKQMRRIVDLGNLGSLKKCKIFP